VGTEVEVGMESVHVSRFYFVKSLIYCMLWDKKV
jgi:hypothetical protein